MGVHFPKDNETIVFYLCKQNKQLKIERWVWMGVSTYDFCYIYSNDEIFELLFFLFDAIVGVLLLNFHGFP